MKNSSFYEATKLIDQTQNIFLAAPKTTAKLLMFTLTTGFPEALRIH